MINKQLSFDEIEKCIRESYWSLCLGLALNMYAKRNDLQHSAEVVSIPFLNDKPYRFKKQLVQESFANVYSNSGTLHSDFRRFLERNAFRNISMAMVEALKEDGYGNNNFIKFLKKKLSDQYVHFRVVLQFIRNCLSHNLRDEFKLTSIDFTRTARRFKENHELSGIVNFNFYYKDHPEFGNSPEGYSVNIRFKFDDLSEGTLFFVCNTSSSTLFAVRIML